MLRSPDGHCLPCDASPPRTFRPPASPARARAWNIPRREQTSAPVRSDRSRRERLSRAAPEKFVSLSALSGRITFPWPFRSLRRRLRQVSVERVKLRFPERAVLGNPCFRFLQGTGGEPAAARAPGFSLGDEASLLQDPQVLHHRRQAHPVGPGQLRDGGLAARQGRDDGTARGVGERLKGGVESSVILNHWV